MLGMEAAPAVAPPLQALRRQDCGRVMLLLLQGAETKREEEKEERRQEARRRICLAHLRRHPCSRRPRRTASCNEVQDSFAPNI